MLNFCNFIQVYIFTTNHHLKSQCFALIVNYVRGVFKYECNWVNFQKGLINNAKLFISILQNTPHHVIDKVSVF